MTKQRMYSVGLVLVFLLAGGMFHWQSQAADSDAKKASKDVKKDAKKKSDESLIYELRTYTTAPGRLPALHARFRDHTVKLFEKHGIKNIAYWTPKGKDNTLVYVIAHKSRKAAKKSWKAFGKDPVWRKAFKESKEDGPIVTKVVSVYLSPTDYSPMK